MEVFQKIRNRTTLWSSSSSFGYLSQEKENLGKYMLPSVHGSINYSSLEMDTITSGHQWLYGPSRCVDTYNGILFSHKKEGNLPFVRIGMDLESIMIKWSEVSHSKKDKYHMDLASMGNLKTKANSSAGGCHRREGCGVGEKSEGQKIRRYRPS